MAAVSPDLIIDKSKPPDNKPGLPIIKTARELSCALSSSLLRASIMLGPIAFAFPSSSLIIEISSSFSWVSRDIVVFSIIYRVVCLRIKRFGGGGGN